MLRPIVLTFCMCKFSYFPSWDLAESDPSATNSGVGGRIDIDLPEIAGEQVGRTDAEISVEGEAQVAKVTSLVVWFTAPALLLGWLAGFLGGTWLAWSDALTRRTVRRRPQETFGGSTGSMMPA
jgi:hypothetical protein